MNIFKKIAKPFAASLALAALFGIPAQAHHSFAMYDMRNIRVFTGVVTRVDPAANHLAIFFAPMIHEAAWLASIRLDR